MPPEHARRVLAGGASRHSGRVLAQRRAVAQHLRDRELHGGTGGCGEAGSRRIATGSARQVAPLILSSSLPPKRAAGDCLCRKVSAAAWPCSSTLQPTWRKLPKSRCRGTDRFASATSSARSIAASLSIPINQDELHFSFHLSIRKRGP